MPATTSVRLTDKQIAIAGALHSGLTQWLLADEALAKLRDELPTFEPAETLVKVVTVNARMRDRLRKAGFKGFMSHRLRHTWATNGHRVGMTVFDLQEEGGWKDTEMVRRYAKGRPFHELQQTHPVLGHLRRRFEAC